MLYWVRIAAYLAGFIIFSKIIFILYSRHRVRSALPKEKASLIRGGGYGHLEDHVWTNGTSPKEIPQLQTKLREEGFDISQGVLSGLIQEEYMMNPNIQKEAIRRGGAYHVIERYAKKFGDDLREMPRLKAVLRDHGFRVEENALERLIAEEHQLYLKIRALVKPGKDMEN